MVAVAAGSINRLSHLPDEGRVIWEPKDGGVFGAGLVGQVIVMSGPRFEMNNRGFEINSKNSEARPTCVLTPLDGKPLSESKKLWLCALSRAENPGMGWDKDRRTVGNKWGTGPALVLGVNAQIKLPGEATWKVEALDPTGAPKAVIAEKTNDFRIDPSHKTCWWLITRE